MKAFIIGAGCQGAACASILSRDEQTEQIILADIDLELAEKVRERIGSAKVKTLKVDASSIEDIVRAAEGCGVIFDMVLPWFSLGVMRAALKIKAHYVNTAFDDPFWDQIVKGEKLELEDEFKEAGLTALLGCGGTPGLLNVFVRYYADQLDTVKSIRMRGGEKSLVGTPLVRPWYPGWAPNQALIDFNTPPVVFRNGAYEMLPIFAEQEKFDFGAPMNSMWVAHHSHEEAYSIPRVIGKGLTDCEFKYMVDEQAATFISMGFVPGNEIEVNGVKVKPFDVLMALTNAPGEFFFEEEMPENDDLEGIYLSVIEMEGVKDGQPKKFKVQLPPFNKNAVAAFKACGTRLNDVALPAVIGGKMCLEGTKTGVIFAEELDPNRFIELLNQKVPYAPVEL